MRTRIIKLLSLISIFVLLGTFVSPVHAQGKPLENKYHLSSAINSITCIYERINNPLITKEMFYQESVKSLSNFLSNRGYTRVDTSALIISIKCLENSNYGTIVILPFIQNNPTIVAHISYWKGMWNNREFKGTIALIESNQNIIYTYDKKIGVIPVTKKNWVEREKIPFNAFRGFAPPLANENEITVREYLQPPTSTPFQINQPTGTTLCKTVDVGKTVYTLLGFVAYRFYQRKYWCYNGTVVSNVNVSVYLTDVDPNFYYRGIVNQWDIPAQGSTAHDSMRQGQIDNCIAKYGCIGTSYPAVQIISYANGSYSYKTWQ